MRTVAFLLGVLCIALLVVVFIVLPNASWQALAANHGRQRATAMLGLAFIIPVLLLGAGVHASTRMMNDIDRASGLNVPSEPTPDERKAEPFKGILIALALICVIFLIYSFVVRR